MIRLEYKTDKQKMQFYKSNAWRGVNGLRNKILQRDNNECQSCKAEGRVTTVDTKLEVHHIKPIEDFPKLATDETNLTLICVYCHNKEHDRFTGTLRKPSKWDAESFEDIL